MSELDGFDDRELKLHDAFILPSEVELEHEIERPKWWYAQQLRLAGATWDEIAKALNYQSGQSAHRTVQQYMDKAVAKQNATELVELELERLDMLQLVIWRQARQGDLKAIDMVLKIMNTRAKYLGLDNQAYENESSGKSVIMIGGDEESYIQAIKDAQAQHKAPIEGEIAS